MAVITREQLEQKKKILLEEKVKLLAQINATEGALLQLDWLLADIDAQEVEKRG